MSTKTSAKPEVPDPQSAIDDAVTVAVDGLAKCDGDALSQALCLGIVNPERVVDWIIRAERLVRFQSDRAELRAEVPAVTAQLRELLVMVDLPAGFSGDQVTERLLSSLPQIRRLLAQDVEAAFDGDPSAKGLAEIVVSFPSIRVLSIHRIAHELYRMGVPLLPRIMSEYAHDRTGIDIHPGAQIGRRFFIDHGTGVVVGETAEIGDRVRLYQGVTIGATSLRDREQLRGVKRHPTLEDGVTVYAGATILGGKTVIGHDSVIGGNVWLTSSVPANSRVISEPPRQLVKSGTAGGDSHGRDQLEWDI